MELSPDKIREHERALYKQLLLTLNNEPSGSVMKVLANVVADCVMIAGDYNNVPKINASLDAFGKMAAECVNRRLARNEADRAASPLGPGK